MYPKLYERYGKYYFKFTDPRTKKRKQVSTGLSKPRKARSWMIDYIDRIVHGSDVPYRIYAQPFTDYRTSPRVKRLLSEGKSIGKKHVGQQASLLKAHVFKDQIADMPIGFITSGDVIDFRGRVYARLAGHPNTADKVFSAFKVVLSEAKLRMDIPANPAAGIGGIKFEEEPTEIMDRQKITEIFNDPGRFPSTLAYQVFRFAAFTGMRSSEILAAQWEQLENGVLTIDRAWKTPHEIGPPKSGKIRKIPLAKSVTDNLPDKSRKYIFCQKGGKRLGKTWWLKNWRKIRYDDKHTMLDTPYRPHSLRHAVNTHLITAGAPLQYIQMYLGWSITGLTRVQIGYTHAEHLDLKTISDMIDQLYLPEINEIPFRETESS